MPRGVAKQDLPEKICVSCGRPFAWRKKWARDWDSVRYCSDGCRKAGPTEAGLAAAAAASEVGDR